VEIGQQYNPRMLFYGVFIPEWLLGRSEISQGAKLCFGVLCRHADGDGTCDTDGESLAVELGVHLRQLREYMRELIASGLIESQRRGLGQTNIYRFLWHPWADSACRRSRQPTTRQEMRDTASQEMRDTSTPSLSQSTVSESAATARAREEEPATPEERALALYREPEANNHVYSFLGAGLYGRTLDEWTERIGDHFRNGSEVTVAHLKQARLDAEAAFDAHGQGKRTMGWYYSALATILNPKVVQGGQAKGKPPARNSQYAGLTLDERVAATLAELENESGKP
jgi:hypothetical protein